MTLKEQFEKDTNTSFDCDKCTFTKYENCCPDENDCVITNSYVHWLENRLSRTCGTCRRFNMHNWECGIHPSCDYDDVTQCSSSPKPEACCPDWSTK